MEAPLITSVEFKNPGTTKMVVHGLSVTKESLTPELYVKLVKLRPSYANLFSVKFEKPKRIKEDDKDKQGV